MISDEIVEKLTRLNRFIERDGRMIFYFKSDEDAQEVTQMLNKWYFARGGYSPWKQDGDHWDHKHPNGIVFHHPTRGCPDLI